ncbi:MAG: hypothetical protein A2Z06_00395 [Candidatus Glassbacteria bacterium RBG_16_58_8]|uniref:Alpha-galactosidase NEW3 domain-containing protein n=1 Tax=Candidatus Glassbacteria bacterium RBG_16_58_8 TaxID=1817866 RepID=A0A1F5YAR0_9BACT|nr:MAG: hypothetical protein A2Z06_00395 [Candidatus Glassbacteria bacterium RBG_16_58_8]
MIGWKNRSCSLSATRFSSEVNKLFGRKVPVVVFCIWFAAACIPFTRLPGQEAVQSEEVRFKILEVKKVYYELEEKKARYERARGLLEQDLISQEEFNKIESDYRAADVDYTRALLDLLYDQPHVLVEEAVKYQSPKGEKRVKLRIKNASGEAFQLDLLPIPEQDPLFKDLQWRNLSNVFVSLKLGETIISQPYEVRIPVLRYNTSQVLDFGLLRDVDEIVVSINFADRTIEKRVYLQKDASANIVSVVSTQFSQEANLGKSAAFDLSLERFTAEDNVFKLWVANLPSQIDHEFIDPKTDAKLTQIKFTEGVTTQDLLLKLYLSDHADKDVQIDRPIKFFVLVGSEGENAALAESTDGVHLEPQAIQDMKVGWVQLELIPRGVGEIEVKAQNLYHEIDPSDLVTMDIVIRNIGTRRLDNISITTDLPYNWRSSVSPDLIRLLHPGKEEVVKVSFYPPEGLEVGDYEAKIKTNAMANNRPVETEDKRVRIHVRAPTHLFGNIALGLSIVGVLLAIVIFGIRLSRR